jgi:hypothetical protein
LLAVPAVAAENAYLKMATDALMKSATSSNTAKPKVTAASLLSNGDIASGLKEALAIGTTNVVQRLGTKNGFNLDPKVHIPLPSGLQKVDKALTLVGMNSLTDDLELRINRAAEAATPKAKDLFLKSIRSMTIADARSILSGQSDAATQYLRKSVGADLTQEIRPLVGIALAESGAIKSYDRVVGEYSKMPLVSGVKDNLNDYATKKTMDGIFYYVAQEEASIRQNPAKRTTDLLKRVFQSAVR